MVIVAWFRRDSKPLPVSEGGREPIHTGYHVRGTNRPGANPMLSPKRAPFASDDRFNRETNGSLHAQRGQAGAAPVLASGTRQPNPIGRRGTQG